MCKWIAAACLVVAMLSSAVGVSARYREGSCLTSNLPDCCKKARSNVPEASIAKLCCNLNCSEPGTAGSSSSFSTQQSTAPNATLTVNAAQFHSKIVFTRHLQPFNLHDSNPRYIKHLALLI